MVIICPLRRDRTGSRPVSQEPDSALVAQRFRGDGLGCEECCWDHQWEAIRSTSCQEPLFELSVDKTRTQERAGRESQFEVDVPIQKC